MTQHITMFLVIQDESTTSTSVKICTNTVGTVIACKEVKNIVEYKNGKRNRNRNLTWALSSLQDCSVLIVFDF